jgi:hypothetical protein
MTDRENEGEDRLTAASAEAADLVIRIMRDEPLPAEVRLAAAEISLNKGELSHRIAKLEQAMAEAQERIKWSLPG